MSSSDKQLMSKQTKGKQTPSKQTMEKAPSKRPRGNYLNHVDERLKKMEETLRSHKEELENRPPSPGKEERLKIRLLVEEKALFDDNALLLETLLLTIPDLGNSPSFSHLYTLPTYRRMVAEHSLPASLLYSFLSAIYLLPIIPGHFEKAAYYVDLAWKAMDITDISLSTIEALLYRATYLFSRDVPDNASIPLGIATRMCQELGIHMLDANPPLTPHLISPEEFSEGERKRRLYWMCFTIEAFSALSFGRPQTIDQRDMLIRFPWSEAYYPGVGPKWKAATKAWEAEKEEVRSPLPGYVPPIFDAGNLDLACEMAARGDGGDLPFFPRPGDLWSTWNVNVAHLSIISSRIAAYIHRVPSRLDRPPTSPDSTFARLWAGLKACRESFRGEDGSPATIAFRDYLYHASTILLHLTHLNIGISGELIAHTSFASESLHLIRESALFIAQGIAADTYQSMCTEPFFAFCAFAAANVLVDLSFSTAPADDTRDAGQTGLDACMQAITQASSYWAIGHHYLHVIRQSISRRLSHKRLLQSVASPSIDVEQWMDDLNPPSS